MLKYIKNSRLRSLASTNLLILAIRLVQFFFAGVVLGIMAYYIDTQRSDGEKASSPYVFSLVVVITALLTQIIYCFNYQHRLFFLWDIAIAIAILLSFFWFLNSAQQYLECGWSSFNPFGSDRCSQTRSVFVMQIILAILWFLTGAIQAYDVWRARRSLEGRAEHVLKEVI